MRVEEPGGPDAVTINPDQPIYQVNVFTRLSEPADVPEGQRGYRVSEWKLHETDVPQVLAWAAEKAGGRPYIVSVASAESGDDAYLIRLFGQDPTRGEAFNGPYDLASDVVPDISDFLRGSQSGQ